ncbi:Fe-S protein [Microbacterium sp. ARD32]|uniref:Fe-S protein n=1 Tax=Microbacterium sp. ARD32 TaxID=2962577 RepID=UPI002882AB89|nr:Fe-S protein [Microbacterium sp. ARD32]MDT0156563.1 Fe-S protein [Microbacterium sp. ARD32]
MSTLLQIAVFVHIIGFALLFGAWAAQAFGGKKQLTGLMNWGLGLALIAGLAFAAPIWGWEPGMSFYLKITVKLVVLLIIGAFIGIGVARQKRDEATPAVIFWGVGVLTLLNAALGLFWH